MSKMQKNVTAPEPLVNYFSRIEALAQPEWQLALRRAGLARFTELGIPTLAHEDWRFTNLAPLTKLPLEPLFETAATPEVEALLAAQTFTRLPGSRLVFINGQYSVQLSHLGALPPGVRVTNLASALKIQPDFVKAQLGASAVTENNPFTALNQAFFLDGGFVHVPAGLTVEEPVQFIHISTAQRSGATIQPRNLIVAEANSKLTVVESYLAVKNTAYFTNTVTELVAGENAQTLGLDGTETFSISGLEPLNRGETVPTVRVDATRTSGETVTFQARLRIDTPTEAEYYRHGGVLNFVLRQLAAQ